MAKISDEVERLTQAEAVVKYGEWSAMSICLGDGVYTKTPASPDMRLRRLIQTISDVSQKPFSQMRVLDLACLEGHYAIEMALQGAESVGIEIRDANLAKASFAAAKLGLENVTFHKDDVRNLSAEKYGYFDVVICSGILYHLSMPDAVQFIENIASVCQNIAVFDTYLSVSSRETYIYNGREYSGIWYHEHDESADAKTKEQDLWASIDNSKSFWLTLPSFRTAIRESGFTSLQECLDPDINVSCDRRTFVAVKGSRVKLSSSPVTDVVPLGDISESPRRDVHPAQLHRPIRKILKRVVPVPVKNLLKPLLRSVRLLEPDATQGFAKKRSSNE